MDETHGQEKAAARWWHFRDVPGVDGVHLECEVRDGRVVVVGLYVHGPEITPSVLRQLPLSRLNASWLDPQAVAAMDSKQTAARLETLIANEPAGSAHHKWATEQLQAMQSNADPRISDLRAAIAGKTRKRSSAARQLPSAGRLKTLRDGGLTEAFFAELARIYREASAQTRAPAKLIADEIDVPVKTVHRWVREARLAGALPPARKGAAG